jgi:ADP-ribose pyrophosphatase
MNKKIKITSSKIVYEGFINIREDNVSINEQPIGKVTCLVIPRDSAIILAQDENGNFIINYEYRHGLQDYTYNCPGGLIEKDEDITKAAERELLEETGYVSSHIKHLSTVYPISSLTNQVNHYFFAPHAKKTKDPKPDPLEMIQIKTLSKKEIISLFFAKKTPVDATLLTAFALYQNLVVN